MSMSAWRRPPICACSRARSSRVCPRWLARRFACLSRPPAAQGCPTRLRACVGVVKPCTRGVLVGMCMNAPFLAGATLVIVHLARREVGGESEGYARCRRCRVASILW